MDSDKSGNIGGETPSSPSNDTRTLSQKLANPLAGLSPARLIELADKFCADHGFTGPDDARIFRLGAQIAGNDNRWSSVEGLTDEEIRVLKQEEENKWANPKMLFLVVLSKLPSETSFQDDMLSNTRAVCSLCATVQGMGKLTSRASSSNEETRVENNRLYRRDCGKRRPRILQAPVRHRRGRYADDLVARADQRSPVLVLCRCWML